MSNNNTKKPSTIFIFIAIGLIIIAFVMFYLSYDANEAIRMNQNAYETAVLVGNIESMTRLRIMMTQNETKAHVFLSSGIVAVLASAGTFITAAIIGKKQKNS